MEIFIGKEGEKEGVAQEISMVFLLLQVLFSVKNQNIHLLMMQKELQL